MKVWQFYLLYFNPKFEDRIPDMNYAPIKDGINKNLKQVIYQEIAPPIHLQELVHCFWQLKTNAPLSTDFQYHIVPDACVNMLFDQNNIKISAITAIHTTAKKLNLGKEFHFIGVQLLPGVWAGDPEQIMNDLVDKEYIGSLNLVEINKKLSEQMFSTQQEILAAEVEGFIKEKLIKPNKITAAILAHLHEIKTVTDMAKFTGLSPRQLQRNLKKATGFTPHDFLKVLRLQQSFRTNYLDFYVDQSHFIHSFRQIIGHTPSIFNKKYDV